MDYKDENTWLMLGDCYKRYIERFYNDRQFNNISENVKLGNLTEEQLKGFINV